MKKLENLMPPINTIFLIGPTLWIVTYCNIGKLSVSSKLVGVKIGYDEIIRPDGIHMSIAEFERYRRETWPMPHETGRNPDNVSLAVRSGSLEGDMRYAGNGEDTKKGVGT